MLHHPHYYPCLKSVPILRIHLSDCSARNKWTNAIMNHILASRVNCHISCKKEGRDTYKITVHLRIWCSFPGSEGVEPDVSILWNIEIILFHNWIFPEGIEVAHWSIIYCCWSCVIDWNILLVYSIVLSTYWYLVYSYPPPAAANIENRSTIQHATVSIRWLLCYLWLHQIILVTARTLHTITVQLWTMQICR